MGREIIFIFIFLAKRAPLPEAENMKKQKEEQCFYNFFQVLNELMKENKITTEQKHFLKSKAISRDAEFMKVIQDETQDLTQIKTNIVSFIEQNQQQIFFTMSKASKLQ